MHALRHGHGLDLFGVFLGYIEEVDLQQLVVFPPAHQREGIGHLAAHLLLVGEGVGQLNLRPQLRRDAK